MRVAPSFVKILGLTLAIGSVLASSTAFAQIGAGSLVVSGATSTPTHWNIPIGVPTTAQICGVTTAEAGDPLPLTIPVWVKSSYFGNTMLTATWVGGDCYEFTYTPPALANGDGYDACNTTIVSYVTVGLNSNNDYCDDGLDNGSQNAAAGFRFVDASGVPIDCVPVGVETGPWSQVKGLYR